MATTSEALIQDILNLKAKKSEKTAAAKSKIDLYTDALQKLAEELDSEEEKEEDEKAEKDEKGKKDEKDEKEKEASSQAEDIVAEAIKALDSKKTASDKNNQGVEDVEINYEKLAKAILMQKKAVDGTGVFGLDKDMTANPKSDSGTAADEAVRLSENQIEKEDTEDKDMGVAGPVDPMKGYSPQALGGEDKPLTPGEVKQAMAKLSDSDAVMFFKLAQVGYDVTVDVLSDEMVEKQAQANLIQHAERVKAAEAYQYLVSKGVINAPQQDNEQVKIAQAYNFLKSKGLVK